MSPILSSLSLVVPPAHSRLCLSSGSQVTIPSVRTSSILPRVTSQAPSSDKFSTRSMQLSQSLHSYFLLTSRLLSPLLNSGTWSYIWHPNGTGTCSYLWFPSPIRLILAYTSPRPGFPPSPDLSAGFSQVPNAICTTTALSSPSLGLSAPCPIRLSPPHTLATFSPYSSKIQKPTTKAENIHKASGHQKQLKPIKPHISIRIVLLAWFPSLDLSRFRFSCLSSSRVVYDYSLWRPPWFPPLLSDSSLLTAPPPFFTPAPPYSQGPSSFSHSSPTCRLAPSPLLFEIPPSFNPPFTRSLLFLDPPRLLTKSRPPSRMFPSWVLGDNSTQCSCRCPCLHPAFRGRCSNIHLCIDIQPVSLRSIYQSFQTLTLLEPTAFLWEYSRNLFIPFQLDPPLFPSPHLRSGWLLLSISIDAGHCILPFSYLLYSSALASTLFCTLSTHPLFSCGCAPCIPVYRLPQ